VSEDETVELLDDDFFFSPRSGHPKLVIYFISFVQLPQPIPELSIVVVSILWSPQGCR
jgi:hypothetical protein